MNVLRFGDITQHAAKEERSSCVVTFWDIGGDYAYSAEELQP
jgi:hypothetical protein